MPPAQGSPQHQHFGSQSHPQPGLGLLLRAEQPPVLPHCLPSFSEQRPCGCLGPAGAASPHFQPNSVLRSLPGCCEIAQGGEGSGGQAGQRSLCPGAAGPALLRAAQGAGFALAWGLPAWLAQPGLGPCLQPCQAGGQQPPAGPSLPPWLVWAGGSCRVRSDPVFFQFSLKPLERHHPHRLARFGLPALTLSVPAQSELSIFVVQYLYTLLKCFMRLTAAVTNQLFGKNKPQSI